MTIDTEYQIKELRKLVESTIVGAETINGMPAIIIQYSATRRLALIIQSDAEGNDSGWVQVERHSQKTDKGWTSVADLPQRSK